MINDRTMQHTHAATHEDLVSRSRDAIEKLSRMRIDADMRAVGAHGKLVGCVYCGKEGVTLTVDAYHAGPMCEECRALREKLFECAMFNSVN